MKEKVSSQMLKGILEGCILTIIQRKEVYGYEISEELKKYGFQEISQGSIYPLLQKLQKQGAIAGTLRESKEGPMRKYYQLTAEGIERKKQFLKEWQFLSQNMNRLMEGEKNE